MSPAARSPTFSTITVSIHRPGDGEECHGAGVDGFLLGKRFLIIDRDSKYTDAFRRMLDQGGCEPLRLPARSPNLNAWAERFVRSIKERLGGMLRYYHRRAA